MNTFNNIHDDAIRKEEIRKQIKKLRSELTPNDIIHKSDIITRRIIHEDIYTKCNNILLYMPINNEVDTTMLFCKALEDGKNIYYPKVYGKNMEFIHVKSFNEFIEGSYGIKEPVSDEAANIDDGLIIMPGVAFDKHLNRIGYGGGYYDRYISAHNKLRKLAICFECQIVNEVPSEAFDIKPEMIVTEDNIYR